MTVLPGPDFPTAGSIHGLDGIRAGLRHRPRHHPGARARRSSRRRRRATSSRSSSPRSPTRTNKARLIENIAELVREKRIEGISDLRDESDRDGIRIVIELKRDAIAEVVLNHL